MRRRCAATNANGEPCGAAPLRGAAYCLMHHPDHADDVAEARRVGGLHRRREAATALVFDLDGLEGQARVHRLQLIAEDAALQISDPATRARTLGHLVYTRLRVLETGELHDRIVDLERATSNRRWP